ncbi:MAG: hypothetical protein ACK58J_20670 [Planctomyces sp.]
MRVAGVCDEVFEGSAEGVEAIGALGLECFGIGAAFPAEVQVGEVQDDSAAGVVGVCQGRFGPGGVTAGDGKYSDQGVRKKTV